MADKMELLYQTGKKWGYFLEPMRSLTLVGLILEEEADRKLILASSFKLQVLSFGSFSTLSQLGVLVHCFHLQ